MQLSQLSDEALLLLQECERARQRRREAIEVSSRAYNRADKELGAACNNLAVRLAAEVDVRGK